jgi:hypothetical protein
MLLWTCGADHYICLKVGVETRVNGIVNEINREMNGGIWSLARTKQVARNLNK